MNKLLIPNGGMPFYGDDLNFVDAAQRDAFKGLLYEAAHLYSGNMILGGCVLSIGGSTFSVSAGYLMIDYEVCYFPGGSWPVAGGATGFFSLAVNTDSGGLKSFANGSSQNTWQVRTASFNAGAIADGPLDYPVLKRYSDAVEALMLSKVQMSTAFSMNNSWAKSGSSTPVLYKHFRQVNLIGDLLPGTLLTNSFTKITTLPVGFRPVQRLKTIQAAFSSTEYGNVMIDIFANGEVYAIATSAQYWDIVSLNVSFTAS